MLCAKWLFCVEIVKEYIDFPGAAPQKGLVMWLAATILSNHFIARKYQLR